MLQSNVRLAAYTNPEPWGRYNLFVIGAGTAGLATAAGADGLGAKVALVERELMGCVPAKALLRSAHRRRRSQGRSPASNSSWRARRASTSVR